MLFLDRLLFVLERQPTALVARTIGLPYRPLLTGRISLPSFTPRVISKINATYYKVAYNELRATGWSARNARRMKYYHPDEITQLNMSLNDKIDFLAEGLMAQKIGREGLSLKDIDIDSFYNEARESIKEGMERSQKDAEEILEKYPGPGSEYLA